MIKLYNFDELKPEEILNRDIRAEKNVEDVVDGIIADVRARGDDALKDYALKFDGAKIDALQVTQEEIDEAFAGMDPYFLETLRQAAENIDEARVWECLEKAGLGERVRSILVRRAWRRLLPLRKFGGFELRADLSLRMAGARRDSSCVAPLRLDGRRSRARERSRRVVSSQPVWSLRRARERRGMDERGRN